MRRGHPRVADTNEATGAVYRANPRDDEDKADRDAERPCESQDCKPEEVFRRIWLSIVVPWGWWGGRRWRERLPGGLLGRWAGPRAQRHAARAGWRWGRTGATPTTEGNSERLGQHRARRRGLIRVRARGRVQVHRYGARERLKVAGEGVGASAESAIVGRSLRQPFPCFGLGEVPLEGTRSAPSLESRVVGDSFG